MFTAFNNSEMINNTLQMECVTIKLFGLTTKILINDFVMFILGLVITVILAEMLADYMFANIEKAKSDEKKRDEKAKRDEKKRDENVNKSDEIKRLKEEIKSLKKAPSQRIIQCNKCYSEYCETEIKTCKIIGRISQQYCINCHYSQSIRKSQSDSKLNYNQ